VADERPSHASLSDRAQEILRRADAQLAAIKAPPPPPRDLPDPPPGFDEEAVEADDEQPSGEDRPADVRDLGQLLDTVRAGIDAARAHLVTLSASLERIAEELDAAGPAGLTLPPQLAEHSRMPSELTHVVDEVEAAADELASAHAPRPDASAANDAARLVAIEMAVAGDTREGVGRRLRNEFGIRDPSSILDDAFGPNPGGSGRRTYGG
jgi:hypothetical protein